MQFLFLIKPSGSWKVVLFWSWWCRAGLTAVLLAFYTRMFQNLPHGLYSQKKLISQCHYIDLYCMYLGRDNLRAFKKLTVLQRLGRVLWQVYLRVCSAVRTKILACSRWGLWQWAGSLHVRQVHWLPITIPGGVAVNLNRRNKPTWLPLTSQEAEVWMLTRNITIQFSCR